MTVAEFRAVVAAHPDAHLHWMLPDKAFVPQHYHITEVGRVQKDFIDCGGTIRSLTSCLLQIWVADDRHHRLRAATLAKIMDVAGPVLKSDDLPIEVEYEAGAISQYPLAGVEVTTSGPLVYLGTRHTACLAPDRCGVDGGGCC